MKAELAVAALVISIIFGSFSPVLFIAVVVFGLFWLLMHWIGGRW